MQKTKVAEHGEKPVLRLTQMLLAIFLHREKGPVQIPRQQPKKRKQ